MMVNQMANNFGRKIKISVGDAHFTNEELEIRFEVPFDDDSKPNQSKIEIYNLSDATISRLKKGDSVIVQAGYAADIGVIANGKANKILTRREGVNKITAVYCIEGDDFTRVKVSVANADADSKKRYTKGAKKGQIIEDALSIGFKPGTDGLTMIKRLVSVLGIKLGAPIQLKKNMVYKKGYIVTKLILNDLETIVRDCGSAMYHRRGKLIIRDITAGTDEKFLLKEDTGLIESPSPFDEDDVQGFNVKCLLQHRITTASIVSIESKTAKGKYRAKKGKHIGDKDTFQTEFQCI
jgi:hypothetical protein